MKTTTSDGTRSDAHNLDDLYERWRLSYEESEDRSGLVQPNKLVLPSDLNDMPDFRDEVLASFLLIKDRLSQYKLKDNKTKFERYQRRVLGLQYQYLEGVLRFIKPKIKKLNMVEAGRQTDKITDIMRSAGNVCDYSMRTTDDQRFAAFFAAYKTLYVMALQNDLNVDEKRIMILMSDYLRQHGNEVILWMRETKKQMRRELGDGT